MKTRSKTNSVLLKNSIVWICTYQARVHTVTQQHLIKEMLLSNDIYFQHINVFMMLLTIIMTMVMMALISAMMIITKYSLPTTDFATRYSTRYSDFLLQPYSNPTRSQKSLLVGACLSPSVLTLKHEHLRKPT